MEFIHAEQPSEKQPPLIRVVVALKEAPKEEINSKSHLSRMFIS